MTHDTSHNVKEEVRDVHVNLCKKSTFDLVNCNFAVFVM